MSNEQAMGVPVVVTVTDDRGEIRDRFAVDFTTHAGRRAIAEAAQRAVLS